MPFMKFIDNRWGESELVRLPTGRNSPLTNAKCLENRLADCLRMTV